MKPFIIGVAGGTSSGKSTVAEYIKIALGSEKVSVMLLDSYYLDFAHLSSEERKKINFDHPNVLNWELIRKDLDSLMSGEDIHMPVYDYSNNTVSSDSILVKSTKVIIIEGIFALLDDSPIYEFLDLKIYVDTAPDIRLARKLDRDIKHRGRTVEEVLTQYLGIVRIMHQQFISPTKRNAHIIIPHGANSAALEMIIARINAAINHVDLLGDLQVKG
jgi:uridine kinase